ncbi:CheR family methyltransferase [Paraburkholderia sp. ZP32-5]|uniref:CheR family methyltransferase n=1 Tax=Paraburkholderia sp. ZP32-5 TaxID=2883245 RepID=UPI001F4469EB|nr:protein-glutamate O-methyltransferase CheR [Paraburkholderia sp. ZP32-5]
MIATITDREFARVSRFIHETAGIHLSAAKRGLVCGRLARRLQHFRCTSFSQYLVLLEGDAAGDEAQTAINLLTTNETFFFRESRHFEMLRRFAALWRERREPLNVWSAACSTGEEPYSIAMVLDHALGPNRWDVLGTDISTRVLAHARRGHYTEERARQIPPALLRQYCRKGIGDYAGTLLVERSLRERVRFAQVNLNARLPDIDMFDCIFLRNVMIYFDIETRRKVVERVCAQLRPGGMLCVGHSESLHQVNDDLVQVAPSVYRKP